MEECHKDQVNTVEDNIISAIEIDATTKFDYDTIS